MPSFRRKCQVMANLRTGYPVKVNLKQMLEAQTTFSFGASATQHTANDFWRWAFSNMDVPVLRGVLIEYLVAKKLIEKCDAIVGDTVRRLTTYKPRGDDLSNSIDKFYKVQPHGDVFDLQLTWGVTVEIKSTASPENWRLHKTCRWNIIKDRNIKESVFPAQFYVLAEMKSEVAFNDSALNVGDIIFHVRTGEELDEIARNQKSIGYAKFVGKGNQQRSCRYDDLAGVLAKLQALRLQQIEKKIQADWRLEGIQNESNILALAVETTQGVKAGWYKECLLKDKYLYTPIRAFQYPWLKGIEPSWRDWEAVGFSFVPEV